MVDVTVYFKLFGVAHDAKTGEPTFSGAEAVIGTAEHEIPYERLAGALSDEFYKWLTDTLKIPRKDITLITKEEYERDYGEGVEDDCEEMCDPGICDNCIYVGEGDFICDKYQVAVKSDWMPTKDYLKCKEKKHEE